MDDQTRFGILVKSVDIPEWERGQFIIDETIKAVRAGDAQLSDKAIRAEFATWWETLYSFIPRPYVSAWVIAWTRHILTRGGLNT